MQGDNEHGIDAIVLVVYLDVAITQLLRGHLIVLCNLLRCRRADDVVTDVLQRLIDGLEKIGLGCVDLIVVFNIGRVFLHLALSLVVDRGNVNDCRSFGIDVTIRINLLFAFAGTKQYGCEQRYNKCQTFHCRVVLMLSAFLFIVGTLAIALFFARRFVSVGLGFC